MDKILAMLKGKAVAIGVAIVGVAVVAGAVVAGPNIGLPISHPVSDEQLAKIIVKGGESAEIKYTPPVLKKYMGATIKAFKDPTKVGSFHIYVKDLPVEIDKKTKKIAVYFDFLAKEDPMEAYIRLKVDGLTKDELQKEMELDSSSANMILPFITGEKWISFTESDIKSLASLTGEDPESFLDIAKSSKNASEEDLIKYWSYLLGCFDIKSRGSTLELALNKEKALNSLKALKNDTTLLQKLGVHTSDIDEYIQTINEMEDDYFGFPMFYIRIKGGKVSEVKMYLPVTEEMSKSLDETIKDVEKPENDETALEKLMREEIKDYVVKSKKDKRLFLGTFTVEYKSVKPDEVPNGKDVVSIVNLLGPFIMMYTNPQMPQTPNDMDNTYPDMNDMYDQDMYKNMPY